MANKLAGITRTKPSRRFPNGGWLVRYRDDENATLRKTFSTRQEAVDFQAQIHTDKRHGDYISQRASATPFKDVALDWLSLKKHTLKPKTYAGYEGIVRGHLIPAFEGRPIGRINAAEIQKTLAAMDVAPGTERNVLRVLGGIMRFAIKAKMRKDNLCVDVDPPRRSN